MKTTFRYGEEDLAGAKSLVDQCPSDDPDTDINLGKKKPSQSFVLSSKYQPSDLAYVVMNGPPGHL